MSNNQIEPSELVAQIVHLTLNRGSRKDGRGEEWRKKLGMHHLIKGLSHLALHIKDQHQFQSCSRENHLHKAISRLAMAATIEEGRNKKHSAK